MPNLLGPMMRSGKSNIIGLVLEDISSYYFRYAGRVIEQEARKCGYSIMFGCTGTSSTSAKAVISRMKTSSVDGMIIAATDGLKSELIKLQKDNIPFVLIGNPVAGIKCNYVVLNNYRGAYDLTRHLYDYGYRKIGFVTFAGNLTEMANREQGFADAMAADGTNIFSRTILKVNSREKIKAISEIKKFIRMSPVFDALFFATSSLGILGMEALRACNLEIGKDIAVVAFDDNDLFKMSAPGITVAAQPAEQLAARSIRLLLDIIVSNDQHILPVAEIINADIAIRESSQRKKVGDGQAADCI